MSVRTARPPARRCPRAGVTILRDKYHVPHVTATSYDGGHLGLRLDRRRGPRAAAGAGPLRRAGGGRRRAGAHRARPDREACRTSRRARRPNRSSRSRRRSWRRPGPRGARCCTTSTRSPPGSTPTSRRRKSSAKPWTRNDTFALEALKGQFVGQGGGDEARSYRISVGVAGPARHEQGHERLQRSASARRPAAADVDRRHLPVRTDSVAGVGQRHHRREQLPVGRHDGRR